MKRAVSVSLAVFIGVILLSFPCQAATVQWQFMHSQNHYEAGKTYPIAFRLAIAKDWYIHGTEVAAEDLIFPTQFAFECPECLQIDAIEFPTPEQVKFDYSDHAVEVFSGSILVKGRLVISDRAPEGSHSIKAVLSYQACTAEICEPPEELSLSVPISIVAPGTPTARLNQGLFPPVEGQKPLSGTPKGVRPGAGLLLTLLGFFLGGLALNLTPCIYPLIPITVSYFGGRGQRFSGQALFHALLYMLGLAFTNSMLGLWAALSGRMVGAALQNPFVLIFMAALFVFLALSSFGFWELRLPAGMTRAVSRSYGGYFGTLFMGLTLGIVAAPCLGPFILGLLTYVGQKGDPFFGFLCFFILSIGLGLPLAVLALFSGAVDRLPLSGDWMVWIRKLMGWVLILMAGYMVSLLRHGPYAKALLFAGVIFAAAIHLGWLDKTGEKVRKFSYGKKAFSLLLVIGACFYLWSAFQAKEGVSWIPYNEKSLAIAAGNNSPVILDFSAEWCGPCRAMDDKVFRDKEILKLSRHFVMLRVDLTRHHPSQDEILKKYGVKGVPTMIFLNSKGIEEKRLRIEAFCDKAGFLARMKELLEQAT